MIGLLFFSSWIGTGMVSIDNFELIVSFAGDSKLDLASGAVRPHTLVMPFRKELDV